MHVVFSDISFAVTISLALFAVVFGTRHTDATEHQDGLILAIATESMVKLVAITTVGLVVVFGIFDGFGDLVATARASPEIMARLGHETPLARWIVLTVLSGFAVLMLPRQFHVTVVENRSPSELRLAGVLFPLYLVAINLFVVPVAIAGLSTFAGVGDRDLYVLTVPLAHGLPFVTLAAFLGGFSAATAMVIVASVAVAIMVSNDIVMPLFLRPNVVRRGAVPGDFGSTILTVRRTAILGVMLLGYFYYSAADLNGGLASIGLLSFAAISQFAPPLLGGLVWRQANARGAIAGLLGGMAIWTILLFVPSLGGPSTVGFAASVLDFLTPGPAWASGPESDPLVNAVILSLLANVALFVAGSLSRAPKPLERIQAGVFIPQRSIASPLTGRWRTKVSVGELEQTVARYLGTARTRRSFQSYEASSGQELVAAEPADMALVRAAERLLGSAIGSASARLVLSLLFQKTGDTSPETARLLDEASEALQYNHDLLETALGQMDQGISVFDGARRLTVWNTRFRTLLDLPETVGQVGFPLERIMDILVRRGDVAAEERDTFIRNRLTTTEAFQLTIKARQRIIEIRSNPMPDKGFVTTYADITERVAADLALKQANETLEARVAKRTAELTAVNRELKEAQAAAEEANIGKTRFLAAVGHDILQPLNAARLYSSSLVERLGASDERELVRHIDSSLESVETILGAVLDLSRLDTGAMKPQMSVFPLDDVLRRVATDFAPIAHEKNLRFTVVETSVHVRSDPNLLRRLIQNLVSNAIKYTRGGRVLIGVRHAGDHVQVQVVDTGIGIPSAKFQTVFKEFARLDEGARTATGLGLGLSIVDRIARVLNHAVRLELAPRSWHGFPSGDPARLRPGDAAGRRTDGDHGRSRIQARRADGALHRQRDEHTGGHEAAARRLGLPGADRDLAGDGAGTRRSRREGRRRDRRLSPRRRDGDRGDRPVEGGMGGSGARPAHHGGPLPGGPRRGAGARRHRSEQAHQARRAQGLSQPCGRHPAQRRRVGAQVLCSSASAPIRDSRMTAWVRLSTSSFCRTAETCALIVASDTPSS